MGRELGRISGPLLADNLLRNGVDLAFETQLLYFDVKNKRIGVKYGSPTVDLFINSTTNTTNLHVPGTSTIGDFVISTNQIQHSTGSITIQPNQSSNPTVTTPGLSTANLYLYGNTISGQYVSTDVSSTLITQGGDIFVANDGTSVLYTNAPELVVGASNINFIAQAAGNINLNNNTTVTGNLHATGNITWDGNIQFGDNLTQDTVSFGAEINSNIIPKINNSWNLGSNSLSLEWANLYAINLKVNSLTSANLTVNNINLTLAQGNTIYVSVNGNDANTGIHQHAPVRTVARALALATAATEVVVFPGTYTEVFPLTVPTGVSVRGAGLRAVTIQPTSGTNTNNAFLLNGETTVSFLTVKGFYAPGNGFSFAPNFTVTTRSPYLQNVTVITTGPNAGNGALVDGSLANSASKEASMLFNAATMIVPDAVGIKATNGARVEWLNCFVYFANKGIYLTNGTQGFAGLVVKFGAEMRSIGSANIYGTYGAVADGANTLGYLIGHNFSYVGSGLDSQNDYGLVIQANEVVRENGGQLYYDSIDHRGDYRIGDIFYVNQQTGEVSFNAQAINLLNDGSILLENGISRTLVQAADIQVANIRIHGNSVDSVLGPINFLAFNGTTNLNTNVSVTGDLQVAGNTTVQGNITFGDAISDTVTIADYLTQTVKPKQNNLYSLGSASAVWRNIYTDLAQFGLVQFSGNQVTTTTASTDLLIQSTTGNINVEYLKFNDNNITNIWPTPTTDTQKSIIFTPSGTGNVEINSTKSLVLPIGNNSTRVLSSNGEIRYNSLYNNIEGYSSTGYVNFFNLYSQNQQTYITPELTPNAADSTLRFAIGNVVTTTISSSTLTTVNLVPGNVGISGSTVQNTQTNTDVAFAPSGTGKINLKSFVNVKDSTVTNATSTDISFNSTNQGHWKFGGKSGVVIPLGTNSDYPITALQGAIRYNTVSGFAEVYTGSAWTSWVGTGNATVTETDMNDLTLLYTLILGY